MKQKPKRLAKFPAPAARSDMMNMPFSLVGRGRLELPTNGLKARCRALRKSGSAQAKQRLMRPICPVRVKFPRTFAIRGFDSLHPLHLSRCQNRLFPSERNVQPSSNGRDRGHRRARFSHEFCAVSA